MNTCEPDSATALLAKHATVAVTLLYKWYLTHHRTYTDDEAQLMDATRKHLNDDWNIGAPEGRVRATRPEGAQ